MWIKEYINFSKLKLILNWELFIVLSEKMHLLKVMYALIPQSININYN